MEAIRHFQEFGLTGFLGLALLAGLSVVVMCGVLSVLVVVKKLGFVGQGISHSAFGGIGLASLLAAAGWIPEGTLVQLAVVVLFCIGAALGISAVSDRRTVPVDTAIGMFLVGSMALGALLTQISQGVAASNGRIGVVQSWESILFGSILTAGMSDVVAGWLVCGLVLLIAWWKRRPMLFWAFDEDAATAFGVPGRTIKMLLMILLALAIVVAMRLAGVVLATALLVLPGATALKLTDRLWPVVGLSVLTGILGLVGGLVLSAEMNWQPGPCVVLVMTLLFSAAVIASKVRRSPAPALNVGA